MTTVRVTKALKPPPPPGPSPSSTLELEKERQDQLSPDPPLRAHFFPQSSSSGNTGGIFDGNGGSPFAASVSPLPSVSSPRNWPRPKSSEKPDVFAATEEAIDTPYTSQNDTSIPPSSSSSSKIGRRPTLLQQKSPKQQVVPTKFLLSEISKPEHTEKGIVPVSQLDAHFQTLLLPGEWLKVDYKDLKLPPPMLSKKATDFIDDMNSQHRHPIRSYHDPTRAES